MTLTRNELVVKQLYSSDPAAILESIRVIKNHIIGNKTKKDLYVQLGAIPRLVELLSVRSCMDIEIKIQAATVLGSLAYGNNENVQALVNSGVIPPLLDCLAMRHDISIAQAESNHSLKLIEATARAIKALFSSPNCPKLDVFKTNGHTQDHHISDLVVLVDLVSFHSPAMMDSTLCIRIAQLAATIIARCCELPEHQLAFEQMGVLPPLIRLLTCNIAKAKEAALDALASLCYENPDIGAGLVNCRAQESGESLVSIILKLTRDDNPMMRLLSATVLTNLFRDQVINNHREDMILIVLPTLIKLLDEPGVVKEKAPLVFADLMRESKDMQNAASETDAIPRLAEIISQINNNCGMYKSLEYADRLKRNVLLAIAAVSSLTEECRKQVIEANVLPHIVQNLGDHSASVRAAACHCARSLSRSVKQLRTSLLDAGIAMPILRLLSDSSVDVQVAAAATVSNIVLDFSPMKQAVLENGAIPKLVSLVHEEDDMLRYNALWALKSLLCRAESQVKNMVMQHLTFEHLRSLINDSNHTIQEEALSLLRNLVCCKNKRCAQDIEFVFQGFGQAQLMSLLEERLEWSNEEVVTQALHVLVGMAIGNEVHKNAILDRPNVVKSIYKYMNHERPQLRVTAVWCVINLTWQEDKQNAELLAGAQERTRRLRQLGFLDRLKTMVTDPDQDVRDRVKTALSHFYSE
ncbi:uncharacterized protein VTP21DRAFT_6021 [Calcarisporiella thermophila]|uniref:uncharacterized protein n=1 Tax=Calcarisporiella thermophila TaxID=911321 RepID=UPI003743D17B